MAQRAKRYVFNANFTCGYVPFCAPRVHDADYVVAATSLADDPNCSRAGVIASIAFDFALAVAIATGNVLIVYVFATSPKLRNPQGMIKCSMAVFDFLVGAVILPATACNKISIFFFHPPAGNYLSLFRATEFSAVSSVLGLMFGACVTGSLFSLLLLTVDRFLAVGWPFLYFERRLMTRRKAAGCVFIVWFLSFALGVMALMDQATNRNPRFSYFLDYMTFSYTLNIKPNFRREPPSIDHGFFFIVIVFFVPYFCILLVTCVTWCVLMRDVCEKRKRSTVNHRERACSVSGVTNQVSISDISITDDATIGAEPSIMMQQRHLSTVTFHDEGPRRDTSIITGRNRSNLDLARSMVDDKDVQQLTKTILMMVVSFTLWVLPFLAVHVDNLTARPGELNYIAENGNRGAHRCISPLFLVVTYLLFLNSLSNFLIYNWRNDAFRHRLKLCYRSLSAKLIRRLRPTS